ncbi:related to tRNA a64-2'-o-ribosylphosphate transferase [Ramularia collo-cygni]|uniref:Related to tRNA a64-2'-o-ribosylphosphate transferase n=1 Tax=Ramularia collo-cygni TaxID=112498 RepID=A0A2D3VEZ0_9PEZI|nr:related to tRNA a64-2'-o-ribosylphosphate transferase [Ramularia collo-cygni]CZT21414.1 related to tRNA a64-2'-o-ribosylphosphate transferase [Ramularia collo-cygni]
MPLQESDLIFSNAASALRTALGDLKRSNLTIKNRLNSIKRDSVFVTDVADFYQLPLIANERCGSWYIPPHRKVGSAYFKSTDGHFGQWMFSLRRLNFQVLDVVGEHGGCVIVDSTRRGKSMPDALSKTAPIWITVLNRLLFPNDTSCHDLETPSDVVSPSEHAQIEARIESHLHAAQSLDLDLASLRTRINNKPMAITWQRPGDPLLSSPLSETNLVVLCTASNQTSNDTSANSSYVQGAADDPESWSLGLDAATFWSHNESLLAASEDELPDLIESLLVQGAANPATRTMTLIKPTSSLWIGKPNEATLHSADFDVVISCTTAALPVQPTSNEDGTPIPINLICTSGKVGSRQLRHELPKLLQLHHLLSKSPQLRLLITCETGKDLSVGIALAVLCLFHNDAGEVQSTVTTEGINKDFIKKRLSWIMVSMPDAAPSRATLQSVNAFLMG